MSKLVVCASYAPNLKNQSVPFVKKKQTVTEGLILNRNGARGLICLLLTLQIE